MSPTSIDISDVPLSAKALLSAAEEHTGLSDWGDPTFEDRFATVVNLILKAGMDADGEAKAVENCLWLLSDRLLFFEDH